MPAGWPTRWAWTRVFAHPLAGVLSAYGMGLADQSVMREAAVELPLADALPRRGAAARRAGRRGRGRAAPPGRERRRDRARTAACTCATRAPTRRWSCPSARAAEIQAAFEAAYRQRFAFLMPERALVVEAVSVEAVGAGDAPAEAAQATLRAGSRRRRPRRCSCSAAAAGGTRRWSCASTRGPATFDRRPGDHRREERHHRGRARLARARHRARPPGARARAAARGAPRDRHHGRPGDAGGVQQPVHEHRRADGPAAAEHRLLGEHQGAAGLLLRAVRRRRRPDRQRAAHAGAPGLDGRVDQDGDRAATPGACSRATSTC